MCASMTMVSRSASTAIATPNTSTPRTKLIREIAEMPREGEAVVQKAQSTGSNASCLAGERQWRDRMGN